MYLQRKTYYRHGWCVTRFVGYFKELDDINNIFSQNNIINTLYCKIHDMLETKLNFTQTNDPDVKNSVTYILLKLVKNQTD